MEDFSLTLDKLMQKLCDLKEVLQQALDNVHYTSNALSENLLLPFLSYNVRKMVVPDLYWKLKKAIQNNDIPFIMKRLEHPDLPNATVKKMNTCLLEL